MAKDMKAALSKSLESERSAVEDRFAKAENLLAGDQKKPVKKQASEEKATTRRKPKPKAVPRMKVIRDSFTLPEDDYELITQVKMDCMKAGVEANKSEIVRAGLKVLASMTEVQLCKAIGNIERVKTGRPKVD